MEPTDPRLVALGRSVKHRRETAKPRRSQEDVARDADMSLRNFQKIEAGGENPTIKTLLRISDALGVTISRLLDGIPVQTKESAEPTPVRSPGRKRH